MITENTGCNDCVAYVVHFSHWIAGETIQEFILYNYKVVNTVVML